MLVIRLQTPNDTHPAWAVLDKKPADWQQGSWERLLPHARGQNIVLLIPGREVLLTQTSINARNQRQLQQALPYALEDSIAGELEEQHIVWQKRADSSTVDVAVMQLQRLREWQNSLQQHKLRAHYILPDVFALPVQEDGVTLWQQGNQVWLRTSKLAGYTCTPQTLPLFIETLLPTPSDSDANDATDDELEPLKLRLFSDQANNWTNDERLHIIPESQAEQLQPESLQTAFPLNLLKGVQDENSAQFRQQWRRWRLAAVLGAAILVVGGGMFSFENYRLQQQLDGLDSENVERFQKLFPQTRNVDPRGLKNRLASEMARLQGKKGKQGGTAYSPLPDLAAFAEAASDDPSLEVEKIRSRNNQLIIELSATDQESIETLKAVLDELVDGTVELQSSRTADRVEASLTLGGNS